MDNDYGLELTANSKVGWAFSLPRAKSCINATETCRKLCYGNGIGYQSKGQKAKRERNFRTCELLLKEGGPGLLSKNLELLVEQTRPRDWLAAKITKQKTTVPWTLRIHDVGDFYSTGYIQAWQEVVQKYDECSFWFYTRSFVEENLFNALTELAELSNCQGWLSVDSNNYSQAIMAKCKAPTVWKLALLQDENLDKDVLPALKKTGSAVLSFPYHHGGRHIAPLRDKTLTVCPAVVGAYELQSAHDKPKPCQVCGLCLPAN